ncbi:adenylate kinase [Streptomyces sp. NPDC051985]|uniref:adenylate kinase n=1 Tax=Streptomyces sp. NPDC051985 TaxID=3155807 RepID=UPI003435D185
MSRHEDTMRILLIGPPGAGKGTQARVLSERLLVPAVSSGDLFRVHLRTGTELGRLARSHIEAGTLVPDALTTAMVTSRLDEADADDGFVIDGFPRTVRQAELLDKALAERGITLDAVVVMDVSEDELVARLGGRRTCGECGTTAHVVFSPPRSEGRCDACGGSLDRRDDDEPGTIARRLSVYTEQTLPLLGWYAEHESLIRLDASGTTEEVTDRLFAALPVRQG